MQYQGGKAIIGKRIAAFIQPLIDENPTMTYFEPFVGAGGVLRHIRVKKAVICDGLDDATRFWNALLHSKWLPPHDGVSKEEYLRLKDAPPSPLRFWAGHQYSFAGQFFRGYTSTKVREPWKTTQRMRDMIASHIDSVSVLSARDYASHSPKKMIVYADPPYEDTIGYKSKYGPFNHAKFWKTMERWSADNIVVVSSLKAPSGWRTVWEHKYTSGCGHNSRSGMVGNSITRKERLFMFDSRHHHPHKKRHSATKVDA